MERIDMSKQITILSEQKIRSKIDLVRGKQVMLDSDLAELYGVETGHLNRAVKRNSERFPESFMFQLTENEVISLRCQNGISKGKGGRRYLPYVFMEQGVAMLSAVLKSDTAVNCEYRHHESFCCNAQGYFFSCTDFASIRNGRKETNRNRQEN